MSEHRGTVDEDTQEFDPFPFEQGEKDDGREGTNDAVREEGREGREARKEVRRGVNS